jgi:Cys-rich four helix bundle protein (predicted Tat secretion target)
MDQSSMLSRRSVVTLSAASAFALAATAARADDKAGSDAGSDAGSHDGGDNQSGRAKYKALIDTAQACVYRGDVCVDHCIEMLSAGKTELKDCLASVRAMLPMCDSLSKLALLDAPRLKEFAKVCAAVCEDCEKECRKHEKHAICKACAESCSACIKECKKLDAA